jgi:hypothetical protein
MSSLYPPPKIRVNIHTDFHNVQDLPGTRRTVYAIECTIASMVATRAMCLWNKLNVEKSHPVAQRKILLRPENIHKIGKLAYEIIPVLSAT